MERDYSNLQGEELEIIIKDGLRSEFWKWLTATYDEGQEAITNDLMTLPLTSWDDVIRVVKLQSSYKARVEIFKYPEAELKAIETEKQNQELLNKTRLNSQ